MCGRPELSHHLEQLEAQRGILVECAVDVAEREPGAFQGCASCVRRVADRCQQRIGFGIELRRDMPQIFDDRPSVVDRPLRGVERGLGLGGNRVDPGECPLELCEQRVDLGVDSVDERPRLTNPERQSQVRPVGIFKIREVDSIEVVDGSSSAVDETIAGSDDHRSECSVMEYCGCWSSRGF
jgi:hypothetical protein